MTMENGESFTMVNSIVCTVYLGRLSLEEWKVIVGQRRFTSGHRTVGREEQDRKNHGGTK